MKIGDLVNLKGQQQTGVVVDIVQKKCWRTDKLGKTVNWNKIKPEPHAIVMVDNGFLNIPATNLDVIP